MSKVLFLYTTDENEKAEELRDFIQAKMRDGINFMSAEDVLADELDIESVLENCACVVLVSSEQANEYIKNGGQEKVGDYVTFDGLLLGEKLKRMLDKVFVVYFQKGVSQWRPDAVKAKRIYMINKEKFGSEDPVIDQLSDWIQSIIAPCTTA